MVSIGKNMQNVDELTKEIGDKGGYGKYIGNSLNRLLNRKGKLNFQYLLLFEMSKFKLRAMK